MGVFRSARAIVRGERRFCAVRSMTAMTPGCCTAVTDGFPGAMMAAFSAAISSRVSPRYCWWSRPMGASTAISLGTALVASSLPPSPVSRMMKFTLFFRKWRRATARASSKKVGGCSQPSASCFRKEISSARASGVIMSPLTRMRSEKSTRWGEVNRPVT